MTRNRHSEKSYDSVYSPFLPDSSHLSEEEKKICLLKVQVVPSVSPLLQTDGQDIIINMNKMCPKWEWKILPPKSTESPLPIDGGIIIISEAF